ncbi:MAG: hypothetical protein E7394_02670 [Ruminococcaceae bacterium]|nr:hypothetical protein [Oscillospiraceae bacterium]
MIKIGNEKTTLIFDGEKGCLKSIQYGKNEISLLSRLWRVETNDGDIEIENMTSFSHQIYGNMLKLFWKNEKALITVTVRVEECGKIYWSINADLSGSNGVGKVIFPIFEGLRFEKEDYLLIGYQNGTLLKNPVDSLLSKVDKYPFWMGRGSYAYENDYPSGLSYQYTAFYSLEEFGYYFATEDENANMKSFRWSYNKDLYAMDFSIINYPENMGKTTNYCMPYEFVLKMYEGDWQDATKLYRKWAIKQKWCKEKLSEKHIPENVLKTDLWRVNHTNGKLGTRTEEYYDTSLMLKDYLDCNIALHWYGWNLNHEHDWDSPDYFPDEVRKIGWPEKLKEWNKRFSDEGIVKIPYTNGRLWEKTTKSWDEFGVDTAAIKIESGEISNEPWSPLQRLVTICPTCALWQNKVMDMCREFAVDEGFDGVYLDQIASFNAMLCFDEKHPHPIGGGSWWNDSYHAMLRGVRSIMGKDRIITTESCCETYIDVFDLFLVLDTCFQHTALNSVMENGNSIPVPLFSMIYGDYALSYGSICCFPDNLDRFEYNYIKNILWGMIPSIEAGEMHELETKKDYLDAVKRGTDFYKENKEDILYGRLLEIPKYSCDTFEITWQGENELKNNSTYTFTDKVPEISAVIWMDKNGNKKLYAYNFADKKSSMELYGKKYEIDAKSFSIANLD